MRAPVHYRYVYEDRSRHGQVRRYFWRGKGHPKVRLDDEPGSEAFSIQYHKLLAGEMPEPAPQKALRAQPQTWRWLCEQYMTSASWRTLEASTQAVRSRILERTWDEPVHPGASETFAAFPIERLTTKALRVLRDRVSDKPEAANGRVKAIRAVYKWAASEEVELVKANPARDLTKLGNDTDGFHTWAPEEIAAYEARHPLGTKARLAFDLLIYTGARRSDVVKLGRPHFRAPDAEAPHGWLAFRPHKTRKKGPMVVIPILEPLAASIAAGPTGELTYLATTYGRPFTAAGFGNWFRDRCNEAGLPQCSAHGLRKAAATRCAEAGASTNQLMAIFGWMTMQEAERYTKAAGRQRMAGAAMSGLLRR